MLAAAVVVVALRVTGIGSGPDLKWDPNLTDLKVYLTAGRNWRNGEAIYSDDPYLGFLYPPLTAVVFGVASLVPFRVLALAWTTANGLLVPFILRRLGLPWERALLWSVAVVILVLPVRETIMLGQVNLMLCALVVCAFYPGGGTRRPLRAGCQVGIATAIKLTPGLFIAYFALERRFRLCLAAAVVMVVTIALGYAAAPRDSVVFWSRLLSGGTGLGNTAVYLYNQSLSGALLRVFGTGRWVHTLALLVTVVSAVVTVAVGAAWGRSGDRLAALSLVALGTLLASPVSWTNHYVWLLPSAVWAARRGQDIVAGLRHQAARSAPALVLAVIAAAVLVVWMSTCPFSYLPSGGDLELQYSAADKAVSGLTAVIGLVFVALMAVAARSRPRGVDTPLGPRLAHGRT